MTYFAWPCNFSWSLWSCTSASSKDFKALPVLFLKIILISLVLTRLSGPKRPVVVFTVPIFASFCVRHRDLSGGRRQVGRAHTAELSQLDLILSTILSVWTLCRIHLSHPWAHLPTGHETIDLKKAVSVRVKKLSGSKNLPAQEYIFK